METGSSGQSRLTLITYIALILAILFGIAFVTTQQVPPATITIIPPPATATPAPIVVYVSGAVNQPGIVSLAPDSRVESALAGAGGAREDADLARVNLAASMRDGDQIHVPALGEPDIALATPSGGVRLRINEATLAELDALPGIGPALAERIIIYREANGGIADLADLRNIEGIGDALIQTLEPLIRFD